MNKKILTYLTIIGLIALLSGCKKDGTMVIMMTNPAAPTIRTMPNLTFLRSDAANVIEFVGTPVDPGFRATANYYLEACLAGNNFAEAAIVYSGIQDTTIKMTVGEINGILLKYFPADQTSSLDFRIRAVLVVDAGTGAAGTGTAPFEYSSPVSNAAVTIFGFPRLDVIGSGTGQKIESPNGDGKYSGFVKLGVTGFTLKNPDTGVVYGTDGAVLAVDGSQFIPSAGAGWYKLTVDTGAKTFSLDQFMIGLVGSATPNAWDAPDQKMDYVAKTNAWNITITLIAGDIKFRKNDDWGWNLGGTPNNLVHNGDNIPVTAGNYTISLTITVAGPNGSEAGTYTITKN